LDFSARVMRSALVARALREVLEVVGEAGLVKAAAETRRDDRIASFMITLG